MSLTDIKSLPWWQKCLRLKMHQFVIQETEEAETHPSSEPICFAVPPELPCQSENIFISNIYHTTILKLSVKLFGFTNICNHYLPVMLY
jgi:hypothetical protein